MVPPEIAAVPLAALAIDVFVELNVLSTLEQLLSEHTSNVIVPVSFASGSTKVAVSVGVNTATLLAFGGSTSVGVEGAALLVLLVIEALVSVAVAAGLPVGVAVSRTIGSLPGLA